MENNFDTSTSLMLSVQGERFYSCEYSLRVSHGEAGGTVSRKHPIIRTHTLLGNIRTLT